MVKFGLPPIAANFAFVVFALVDSEGSVCVPFAANIFGLPFTKAPNTLSKFYRLETEKSRGRAWPVGDGSSRSDRAEQEEPATTPKLLSAAGLRDEAGGTTTTFSSLRGFRIQREPDSAI